MPKTLAQLIRAKHQGVYDDLSDEQLERSVKSKYPGVYDDMPTSSLPTRPVSAEDFTGPERSTGDKALAAVKGFGRQLIGGTVAAAKALSDLQRGTLGGDIEAHRRTGERLRGMIGAQAGEFRKAANAPTLSEAVGHTAAGLVPLVGPAAAAVGEKFETDPYEALGEGAGLLASLKAPEAAARAPAAAQAAGRGIAAAGKASLPALKTAATVAEYIPVLGEPFRQVSMMRALRDVLEAQKPAKPAVSPNAGGTLVKTKAPRTEAAISDALRDIDTADVPQSVTLPPQPELPPGYTPRTTVPKPKPAKMAGPEAATIEDQLRASLDAQQTKPAAPKPRAERPEATKRPSERKRVDTSMGSGGYFLKKKPAPVVEAVEAADSAPVAARPEPRVITMDDLPEPWKQHTGQTLTGHKSRTQAAKVPKISVTEVRDYLRESGLSAEEAIDALGRDRALPTAQRIRLVEAINKTRFLKD